MSEAGTDLSAPLNKEQRWEGGREVRPSFDSRAEPNARDRFRDLRAFAILLSVSFAVWYVTPAIAVPASPDGVEVEQPDGRRFRLHLRGDEFFSWHETAEGHAVVKDPADGFWKFARPAADRAAFQAIPEARVGSVDPVRYGVGKHALPDAKVLRAQVRERQRGVMGEPVEMPVPSAVPGGMPTPQPVEPPPSRIPVSGTKTIKNIVLLACFADHWNAGAGTVLSTEGRVNVSEYQNLFNEVNHTADGAVGSVRDYYNEVSYGKLTIDSVVSSWVVLPQNEAYYGTNSSGSDMNPRQMVLDAINAAATAGFDFSQGDSDGDGWVDSLTVIHSGHGEEYTGNPATCIWSHQWNMGAVVTENGIKMYRYHTESALRGLTTSTSISRIGVICHEMGHFFGLPDLYAYSARTLGIGSWGIMAQGSWNGSDGKRPAHFCAWSKCFLGFANPVQIHSQAGLSQARVEDNAVVGLLRDGTSNGEYFLIENRAKTGFDNDSAIYPGILIYHVDSKSENNDLGTWPHPVVKIEEADGDNSLGGITAYSEAGDVWTSTGGLSGGLRDQTGNQSANAMMYQAAHEYNRSDNSTYYSYNRLNNFSAAGSSMTFDATTLKTVVGSQTVASPDYTVSWAACSQATKYELQEGARATLTSLSDGAEDEDAMYDNWYLAGTVQRSSAGKRSGSYSYLMQRYDGSKWYSSVQSMTMRKPFMVNDGTVISFHLMSHLSSGYGDLKCQISNDSGNTWKTLGAYNDYLDPWSLRSHNYTALNAQGINAGDACILRFVANFEVASGWSAFPGYGFALDDISITGTEIAGYGGWTTLNNNITATSYGITGKPAGVYAYRVRAYANATWQGYGSEGETTVDLPTVILGLTGSPMAEAWGVATVTATLSAASGLPVTVNLAFSGTATLASDYTRSGTSMTIAAGSLSGAITLTAVQDTLYEGNETIVVDIDTVVNGTESGTQQVTATITDDDPQPGLSIADVALTEGNAGTTNAVFIVSLSTASGQTVTVDYATADGTATAGSDYVAASGTLAFPPGVTSADVIVTVNSDTLDETNETFFVNLSGAVNATISDSQGVGAINNQAPTISDVADQTIAEDSSTGPLSFSVSDVDTTVASLVVTGHSSNLGLIPDSNLVFGGSGTSRTVTVTPLTNQNGMATITLTVSDGISMASDTFVVTVNPVNDAPVFMKGPDLVMAQGSGVQTNLNWATGISPGPPDEAGQSLSFLVAVDRSYLFEVQPALAANGALTFTPAMFPRGTATISIRLQDDGGLAYGGTNASAPQTFTITIGLPNDADSDGMPDDYEVANGLNPNSAGDANIDSDGDGFTNVQEYQAGTDPHNANDFLRISRTEATESGAMNVSFTTVMGKRYRLERNDNFPAGVWNIVADQVAGTGSVVQLNDTTSAGLINAVYRVVVLP